MNTYLVFREKRKTQEEHDSTTSQEDRLLNTGFIHVCGGPGTGQSQWWKEGWDKAENKKIRSMPNVVEVSRIEKRPFDFV